jgi:hypothetical protein
MIDWLQALSSRIVAGPLVAFGVVAGSCCIPSHANGSDLSEACPRCQREMRKLIGLRPSKQSKTVWVMKNTGRAYPKETYLIAD